MIDSIPYRKLFIFSVFLLYLTLPTSGVDCPSLRGDCEQCLQHSECAYCASQIASGCFDATFGTYCALLGGTANNCEAVGTSCVNYTTCESCQANSPCAWCQTENSGYCFDWTIKGDVDAEGVCGAVSGTFNPSTCESTPTSTSSSTGSTPSTAGRAKVDPQGRCEDFEGSRCSGVVFFDVFANATYDQVQMSNAAALMYAYSSLPGVSGSCRTAGELLNCATYFQKCETLTGTSISVSIPPCRSLCENFNRECAALLAASGLSLDCFAVDPVTGSWRYPEETIVYEYNQNLYELSCNDMTPNSGDAGYYPNRLRNGNFQQVINGQFEHWENLNDAQPYFIANDTVLGRNITVLGLSGAINHTVGAFQLFNLTRGTILPIRISGYIRSSTDFHVTDLSDFAIKVSLVYEDGTEYNITAPITQSNDYLLVAHEFTPEKVIRSGTFTCMANNASGDAYFSYMAIQEKLPPNIVEFHCFEPFEYDPDWEAKGSDPCAFACPSNIWTNQWLVESLLHFQQVFSWISMICSSMLIVTWLVFPKRRKYPDRLALYFAISAWIMSLQGVSSSFYSRNDIICKDKFTPHTQHTSSLCAFSGFILQFGAASAIGWWTCIAISTWTMVKWPLKEHHRMEKYFHIVVWTYAVISTIVPLAAGKVSNGIASIGMCWINTDDDSWWQFATFYIPLGFCLFIAAILVAHAMYTIYIVSKYAKRKQDLNTYFRFLGFLMIVGVSVAFLFGYKFYTFANEDRWYDEFAQELICKVEGGSDCKQTRVDSASVFLNGIIISLQGVFISMFFGLQQRNIQLWKDFFRESKLQSFITTKHSTSLSRGSSFLERSNNSGSDRSAHNSAIELETASRTQQDA